jgi:hypothetical protein
MKRKIISKAVILLLISNCAGALPLLRIEDRTLLIGEDGPFLVYPYNKIVCKHPDRLLFKQCKEVHEIIKFDLSEKETRDDLRNLGFKCNTISKYKYY